ncbi:hypothetical protein PVAP13_5NG314919 [Panicum virgatum]|uniref:Uncharacterized protein n=1 Tax=Panicum virgatum TaxID=38727 RepID=A0A8T0RX25_PANVG|nr:hypothetical protein PVAP13_5NG314919 [Panicum virgatum]
MPTSFHTCSQFNGWDFISFLILSLPSASLMTSYFFTFIFWLSSIYKFYKILMPFMFVTIDLATNIIITLGLSNSIVTRYKLNLLHEHSLNETKIQTFYL